MAEDTDIKDDIAEVGTHILPKSGSVLYTKTKLAKL